MITFMHCKAVTMHTGLPGSLACGLVLRLGLVSGLYKWLFYLATVRQLTHNTPHVECVLQLIRRTTSFILLYLFYFLFLPRMPGMGLLVEVSQYWKKNTHTVSDGVRQTHSDSH